MTKGLLTTAGLVGLFMAASTLIAYFFWPDYFYHWMALVGGGVGLVVQETR